MKKYSILLIIFLLTACLGETNNKNDGFELEKIGMYYVVSPSMEAHFETNVFDDQARAFYAYVTFANQADTTIKGVWYHNGNEIEGYEIPVTNNDQQAEFSLSIPDNGWPHGNYEFKFYVFNDLIETVEFEVKDTDRYFYSSAIGLFLKYDRDAIFEYEDNIVLFGFDDYLSTNVNIQNLLSTTTGGYYDSLEDVYIDYKAQFDDVGGAVGVMNKSTNEWGDYISFIAEYDYYGGSYKQETYIIERDDIFHQIAYTALVPSYEVHYSKFQEILDSLEIIKE